MATSRGRSSGKGDTRSVKQGEGLAGRGMEVYARIGGDMSGLSDASEIKEHMLFFAYQDDGYMRYIPDGDVTKVYIKYKWTAGRWSGHYVMAVVDIHEIALGLRLLRAKVTECQEGKRAPTLDRKVD